MEGSCEYIEYAVADSLRGGPLAWGLVEGLTTTHRKKEIVTKPLDKPRNWADSLERPRQTNKDMRIGTWNVTSLYRTGAVTLVAQELVKYRLDLVGVQEVRWKRYITSR